MNTFIRLVAISLALVLASNAFAGKIVKCEDETGHITYTEYVCPAGTTDTHDKDMSILSGVKYKAPKVDKSAYYKVDETVTYHNLGNGRQSKRVMEVLENGYGDRQYRHFEDGRLVTQSFH